MKESLIGEEISIAGLPGDVAGMVLDAAVAFLEAADGDPPEAESWRPDLDSALASLQAEEGSRIVARLQTTAAGMRVTLSLSTAPDREASFLCNL